MTGTQRMRMHRIVSELAMLGEKDPLAKRLSDAGVTKEEIKKAVESMVTIIERDNGRAAFDLIAAWKRGGLSGAVRWTRDRWN